MIMRVSDYPNKIHVWVINIFVFIYYVRVGLAAYIKPIHPVLDVSLLGIYLLFFIIIIFT